VRQALIEQPSGFYPYFDQRLQWRRLHVGRRVSTVHGDRAHWNIAGHYSLKGYKLIRADAVAPGLLAGHVDLRSTVGWRDATQVRYHGLGIESPADMDTAFRMQQTFGGGDATAHIDRWLHLTAGASYEHYAIHDPTGDLTSVQDVFTADAAPGVGVDPSYIHSFASVALDWRRPGADDARSGGLYQVTRHFWKDVNSTYSFDRLDSEVVQHVPILRENWVISLRGRLESTLDRHRTGAVLPAALAWQRQHAARLRQLRGTGSSATTASARAFMDRRGRHCALNSPKAVKECSWSSPPARLSDHDQSRPTRKSSCAGCPAARRRRIASSLRCSSPHSLLTIL
jgi:hypothetical protein